MKRPALPCEVQDPDDWFPVSDVVTAATERAVAWCQDCPIKQECLDDAIRRGDTFGIYGGTTPLERRAMRSNDATEPPDLVRRLEDAA